MKKVKYIVRFVLRAFLIATLVITPFSYLSISAQEGSLWVNGETPVIAEVGSAEPFKYPSGSPCQDKRITVFKNLSQPQLDVDACTVGAEYGEVGSGFLKFKNTSQFIRLDSFSVGGVIDVPNIEAMYITRTSAGQRFMHAFNNPVAKFQLGEGTDGWSTMLKATSGTDWALRNDNNQLMLIREYAISNNGRFMAIEVAGGIIKFDTLTRQFFKFTTTVPSYGVGKNPELHMAISNDGRYVAVAGLNYGGNLDIYDLEGCVPPTEVNSVALAAGCSTKRLTTFMQSALPGFGGATQLAFSNDVTQLYMNAVGKRIVLQAPNTVPHYLSYLGLGDSFSSGEGAYSYLPGTDGDSEPRVGIDTSKDKCHVSELSYPLLIGLASGSANNDHRNIACSGAISADIVNDSENYRGQQGRIITSSPGEAREIKSISIDSFTPGRAAQIEFVEKYKPQAITLTVGGNDVGFSEKLGACVISPISCKYAVDPESRRGAFNEIQNMFDTLSGLYDKLHETSPNTKIYVLGYPNFIGNAEECGINTGFLDSAEREFIKSATAYMNSVIESAAQKAGVKYMDISNSLSGKELCSNSDEKAVNGIKVGNDTYWIFGNESFHPNALGHSLIASAFEGRVDDLLTHQYCPNNTTACPDATVSKPSLPADVSVLPLPQFSPALTRMVEDNLLIKNVSGNLETLIQLSNLLPGVNVSFELHSNPTPLGSAVVDANGKINTTLTIPNNIPAGYHTLHAYTTNLAGEKVDLYQHIAMLGPEGDRDEDGVDDSIDPCPFVAPANVDADHDGIDDACDGEITKPTDTAAPIVTGSADREPNEHGWYNSDVTINWSSADPEPSSGTPTIPPATTVDQEGINTYTSESSCDPANNCSTGSLEVKLDKTAPLLGTPLWIDNPRPIDGTSTVQFSAQDNLSGVAEAEYYLGDHDPGQGNGATMTMNQGGTVSTVLGTDFPTGVYKITVRAKDYAGNWSQDVSDYLVVHNSTGTRMIGKRTFIPSLEFGDNLLGLIDPGQEDKAKFGFNVRYDKFGFIHPNSDFQFKYETGSHCQKPAKAANCHDLELNATSISWLTTFGINNSNGAFQGVGLLKIDGVASNVVFRLSGVDGERLSPENQDYILLKIYPAGSNPDFTAPIYKASGEVLKGNIKIKSD